MKTLKRIVASLIIICALKDWAFAEGGDSLTPSQALLQIAKSLQFKLVADGKGGYSLHALNALDQPVYLRKSSYFNPSYDATVEITARDGSKIKKLVGGRSGTSGYTNFASNIIKIDPHSELILDCPVSDILKKIIDQAREGNKELTVRIESLQLSFPEILAGIGKIDFDKYKDVTIASPPLELSIPGAEQGDKKMPW